MEAASAALATGLKVAIMDFDTEFKSIATVVAHVVIVSLVIMMHGHMIEEGNAFVMISSIVPGSEAVFLFKGNNDDDPPMVRLGDALNFVTKWPIHALKVA